tara:strand:+ start:563 stop:1189 length:627 start_codon:yes stop_codon:yes gene_type:complete
MSNSRKKVPALTSEQIKQIRELFDNGVTRAKTAEKVGISSARVQRVVQEYREEKERKRCVEIWGEHSKIVDDPNQPRYTGNWEDGLTNEDIPALKYRQKILESYGEAFASTDDREWPASATKTNDKDKRKNKKLIRILHTPGVIVKKFKPGFVLVNDLYVVSLNHRGWRLKGCGEEKYHGMNVIVWLKKMLEKGPDKSPRISVCGFSF